jgi:hypothetical protein
MLLDSLEHNTLSEHMESRVKEEDINKDQLRQLLELSLEEILR